MKKIFQLFALALVSMLFVQCDSENDPDPLPLETVTDIDGNVYNTITLGGQTWMLENLKTTTFNDGASITEHMFGVDWGSLNNQEAQYQWADTSDLNNVVDEELAFDVYGAMYNHWAIESGKLAPEGWRIPTEADFMELENFLASEGHAGNQATVLKSATGWLPSTGNGTNLYGFNGLPNGYINALGGPTLGNGICTWATNDTTNESLGSRKRTMIQLFDVGNILYAENAIQIGAGIRCIKEQ